MIEQGIYPDLSNEDYHGDKSSVSRSSIKDFYKNPYYYYSMHLDANRPIRKPTQAMIFGSAFHTFILEPLLFDAQYAIEPTKVLLKDVGREAYDAYKAECEALEKTSKIVLSADEYSTLLLMRLAIEREDRIKALLTGGEVEKSFFWKDEKSGLMIKSRPDVLHPNMIIDLKTTNDASEHAFQRSMVDGWYHVQGAMVRDAVKKLEGRTINTVINICVEKQYPFCVGIYIIEEPALDFGESLYKSVLLNMKSCIIKNDFTGYEVRSIGLPAWALTQ